MTAICATMDVSGFMGSGGSCGFSDTHNRINDMFQKAATHAREAFSLGLRPHILSALEGIWEECSVHGWNGYNAAPVSIEAMRDAYAYCEQLATHRIPDVYADPRGGVIFEWRNNADSFFLLSFAGNETVSYAGVFGNDEVHGTSRAIRILPENVREIVAAHFS